MANAGKSAFYAQFRQIATMKLFVAKLHALGLRPLSIKRASRRRKVCPFISSNPAIGWRIARVGSFIRNRAVGEVADREARPGCLPVICTAGAGP
jgi:hypothetical protein